MLNNDRTSPFLLCVKNEGHAVSLEIRKVYRSIADPVAATRGFVRVLDESGEDYLYPVNYFETVELSVSAALVFAEVS